jgi:hypothetical protein
MVGVCAWEGWPEKINKATIATTHKVRERIRAGTWRFFTAHLLAG